ncbi:MAG: TraM recognition domain-containing protein [candidate division WWE3 bacterium]|nr:TraM recognition domain-containing protein [candidate division WWE3 bacterium]
MLDTLVNTLLTVFISILALGVIAIAAATYLWFIRLRDRRHKAFAQVFFKITVPEGNEIEIKAAEQMFAAFSGLTLGKIEGLTHEPDHISFEIVGTHNRIEFYVSCPKHLSDLVTKQIHASYPEADFEPCKPWNIWKKGSKVDFGTLDLTGADYFPIRSYEDKQPDPLNALTSALSKLDENEGAAIQLLIRPSSDHWRTDGEFFVEKIKAHNKNPEKKPLNISEKFLEGVEKKVGKPGFNVCLRLVAVSSDKFKATLHLKEMITSFAVFGDPTYSHFKKIFELSRKGFMESFIMRLFPVVNIEVPLFHVHLYNPTFILNTAELATIFHLPSKEVPTPGIQWLKARTLPAPANTPTAGLYLGKNVFRGVTREVYMQEKDRNRHTYILGQTGTGKSEFMKAMAVQDMEAGRGLAFIDPHGTAIEDLLKKVPQNRIDDVILFDAGDLERPMGFNMLEANSEVDKHFLINAFIQLLYKLYDPNHQGIMGPQLERAIRNVMLTAMEDPESTMVEVLKILIDPKYAKERAEKVTDPMVKSYWLDEIAHTSERDKSEKLGYFTSKFDRFVTEKTMRNILGQSKSSFNFRKVMDEGKILLIDLSKGKIGEENSIFLGLLFVPRILSAALARVDVPEEQRRDFYLYVDEFQNFATPDFATILSEARKYHLNLIVGNQFIAQMDDDIKNAVFGNVGTQCIFRVGPDDAEFLEPQFDPQFTKSDLMSNPTGSMYIRLLANNQPLVPFSLKVDWEAINKTPKSERVAAHIRSSCRLKYGKDHRLVEAQILSRLGL